MATNTQKHKSLPAKQDHVDYIVIRDIPYCTTDCNGKQLQNNLQEKYTTDLYLPKVVDANTTSTSVAEEKPPFVVYVYGGGWRRGDKDSWKYFISEDINLLIAFINWSFGLYGNIGKAFARRGIPCAVMSHPLTKLRSPWTLMEICTSYLSTLVLLSTLFGGGLLLLFLLKITFSVRSFDNLLYMCNISGSKPFDLALVHLVGSNVFVFMIISFQYRKYHNLNVTLVILFWIIIAASYPFSIINGISPVLALFYLFLTSFAISQGIILMNILTSSTESCLTRQFEALAMCIKKIQEIGEESGDIDIRSVFVMGHSSGGHICTMTALEETYLQKAGVSPTCIKGVLCISAVLSVDKLVKFWIKQLHLHPTFGTDPLNWKTLCPLYKLKTRPKHIPKFLIVTGADDAHTEEDARVFIQELRNSGVYFRKAVIHGTNHMTIAWYFDRYLGPHSSCLADICIDFIKCKK